MFEDRGQRTTNQFFSLSTQFSILFSLLYHRMDSSPAPAGEMNDDDWIDLICISVHNKLRVRIISPHFVHTANVQFPRNLRQQGARFSIQRKYIHFCQSSRSKQSREITEETKERGSSFYYSVRNIQSIRILTPASTTSDSTLSSASASTIHLDQCFQDTDTEECAICMANLKSIIFLPCHHFYCCHVCSNAIKQCPICRVPIRQRIDRSQIQ